MAAGNRRFDRRKGNTALVGQLAAEVDNIVVFIKKVSVVSHPVIVLIYQVIHAGELEGAADSSHAVQ